MRRYVCVILNMLLIAGLGAQANMFDAPLSPRLANYTIEVRLDTETRKLYGKQKITWTNKSGDFIPDLQFHLYLNAFRNDQTTFMRESGGRHRSSTLEKRGGWGWTKVTQISLGKNINLLDSIRFIQPDDGNIMDETVMQVMLPEAVKPYETIEIFIEFEARLPQVFARTGYYGDFYLAGQWFPKIGVYEAAGDRYATVGQWNCHQFHLNSEFYADFGVYDVKITLPDNYIVGATGIRVSENHNQDGTKTWHYYCEDVHDFAWTADTDFIVVEDEWQHVKIKYLVQPMRGYAAQRHIDAAKVALEFLEDWFGPYPYPTLTIVDPQYKALGAGGMEYPTFITTGMFWLIPEGLKLPEEVTVHEFGHNYFYGLVANNEFEEAWLDEGITTYVEIKMMDEFYGRDGGSILSLFGIDIWDSQLNWSTFRRNAKRDAIFKNSWEYERGGYGTLSYNKPGLMMLTLENHLGREKMKEFTREYFKRYKFKHPTTRDFIETFNDVTGEDYNWFFDQVIYGSDALDYAVDRIVVKRKSNRSLGIFGDPSIEADSTADTTAAQDTAQKQDTIQSVYTSKVYVDRAGEVWFPVEILVKFSDGTQVLENWDGKDRYKVLKYEQTARVISAQVDPERKIWLDVDFLNNGKTVKKYSAPVWKYATRWLFWAQNILHLFSIFS